MFFHYNKIFPWIKNFYLYTFRPSKNQLLLQKKEETIIYSTDVKIEIFLGVAYPRPWAEAVRISTLICRNIKHRKYIMKYCIQCLFTYTYFHIYLPTKYRGREGTLDCKLPWYQKFYQYLILLAGSKTLGTFIEFWLVACNRVVFILCNQ